MKWDDLLGLLFLVIFLVLPALRGVLTRGAPEAAEPTEPPPPPKPPGPPGRREQEERPIPEPRPVATAPEPPGPPVPAAPPPEAKGGRGFRIRFEERAILEGIVWHEILSEPRARRRWKPKR